MVFTQCNIPYRDCPENRRQFVRQRAPFRKFSTGLYYLVLSTDLNGLLSFVVMANSLK